MTFNDLIEKCVECGKCASEQCEHCPDLLRYARISGVKLEQARLRAVLGHKPHIEEAAEKMDEKLWAEALKLIQAMLALADSAVINVRGAGIFEYEREFCIQAAEALAWIMGKQGIKIVGAEDYEEYGITKKEVEQ